MKIEKTAVAGTLESSDAMVTIEAAEEGEGIELILESAVLQQYGKSIKKTVLETLERLSVRDAKIHVIDKGALDCTLKARVECAVFRSAGQTRELPWGGAIHS